MRLFIALSLTENTRAQIENNLLQLYPLFSQHQVRWIIPNNWHVTMKFVGEVENKKIIEIIKTLNLRLINIKPFDLSFSKISYFPSASRSRLIVLNTVLTTELSILYQTIETTLFTLGYELEHRSFKPHVSLARLTSHAERLPALSFEIPIQAQNINEVILFQSDLHNHSVKYTAEHRFKLE